MARRANIIIDAKKLDIYKALLEEIKAKGYPIDENTTTIKIHALAEYKETIYKDLGKLEDRLNNYIAINGNKRVSKNELCKILRISRPTLNRWIKKGFISWDYFGASFDLLQQWLLILRGGRPDDSKMLEREFWGDCLLDVFGTDKEKSPPISLIDISCSRIDSICLFCKTYRRIINHESQMFDVASVRECEKQHDGPWAEFWNTCDAIRATTETIRWFKMSYQRIKYKKHNNYGFPATINLMSFLQQIKLIKNNL